MHPLLTMGLFYYGWGWGTIVVPREGFICSHLEPAKDLPAEGTPRIIHQKQLILTF